MTAAYTCPRCVNLIEYGIPHACSGGGDRGREARDRGEPTVKPVSTPSTPDLAPEDDWDEESFLSEDWDEPVDDLCDEAEDLAPGGTAQPADVPPDRRTEGAATPEAGARALRWGALPAGEGTT